MVGEQGATASAGPADVKPKENAMREVKILMLHGKLPALGKVAGVALYQGTFYKHSWANLQRAVDLSTACLQAHVSGLGSKDRMCDNIIEET